MQVGPSQRYPRLSIYRQDAAVSNPSEETLSPEKLGQRLQGPRTAVLLGRGERRAYPNSEGDYLFDPENPKFNQVQSFVTAQKTLDLFSSYANRELEWAFERDELGVIPHAGEGRNAFYARWSKSVSFYSFDSRELGKRVHTSASADVVSHETGHALLDGMKPEYGKTFDRETKAMHEAFGDCAAMLLTLSREENRADALKETGGDLRRDNCISRIAEEFGEAVRLANRNPGDDQPYLRNANNTFTYAPPETLPKDGPRDTLSAESHSFCQIFTRAFYNGVVNLYQELRAQGAGEDQALAQAGTLVGACLAQGVTMAAPNRARFKDVGLGMIRAARLLEEQACSRALEASFREAGIVTDDDLLSLEKPLPQGSPEAVLEGLGLRHYRQVRTVKNDQGWSTIEFMQTQERPVQGRQAWAEMALSVDVSGGVSLTYDDRGKLLHVAHLELDEGAEIAGLPSPWELLSSDPETAPARLRPTERGHKVERVPVFVD